MNPKQGLTNIGWGVGGGEISELAVNEQARDPEA